MYGIHNLMDPVSQIKQTLDIVDVIGGYVSLKKAGKSYKGLCPFHGEKTPSFMVSPELQIYKCFGCGAGGDMFSFIEQIEGIDFINALEILAERAGVTLEKVEYDPKSKLKKRIYDINELATRFYNYVLTKHKSGAVARKYLKKERSVTDASIDLFRLGYAIDSSNSLYKFLQKNSVTQEEMLAAGLIVRRKLGNGFIDKFRGRVIFPLAGIDGRTVGFTGRDIVGRDPKYLNTPETPVFYKSSYLFGLDKAKIEIKKYGAIVTEGQMDVISAHQNGIKNVIASSGTSLTENQLRILSRYTNDIVFCFDSDQAGLNAVYRAIGIAEKFEFNIKVIMIPDGYKDLDELIKTDLEKTKRIIETAVSVYDYFLATLLKKYDKTSAIGKKNIVNELAPYFSRIGNMVLLDHYVKQISKELDIREETVRTLFDKDARKRKTESDKIAEETKKGVDSTLHSSKEMYLLGLLIRSGVDTIREFIYKINADYINDNMVKRVVNELGQYIEEENKPFDIKKFIGGLDDPSKALISDLYLETFEETIGEEADILRELELVLKSLKSDFVKRELKNLSERIKLAEMSNEKQEVQKLTRDFKKLSQELVDKKDGKKEEY
ncbi:DNA primase [Patescibacteria group bacterium]|nr:DNA primase [Patescibacteria group bacterium]